MLENLRIRVFRAVAHHLNFQPGRGRFAAYPTGGDATDQGVGRGVRCAFDRGGGRITLTPAGLTLLPFAERRKTLSDETLSAVSERNGQRAGELALGASQTIAQYLLPKLIAKFRELHSKVQVTACSGLSCWT